MKNRVSLLVLAVMLAACAEPATQPAARLSPSDHAPSLNVSPSSGGIVIDDFTAGSGTWSACGNDTFNYLQDASIVGGARELVVRDGGSCHFGPFPAQITIDATAGTAKWYGNNTYAPEQHFVYGTSIGTVDHPWSLSPNKGKGTPLHLALSLTDKIVVQVSSLSSAFISIQLRDAAGNNYGQGFTLAVGTNTFPLSSFPGLTAAAAHDIDGLVFSGSARNPGDVVDYFAIQPSDNTPPVISPSVTGTLGSNGWYTSDVNVSWSVTDPDSPVSSKSGCDAVSVTTDTDGQTIICSATSAGGSSSQTVTIKRDATPPTVSYSGNSGSYTVDQSVAITCSASDATNPGSGLASSTCQNVNGAAYTFAIGANSYSATATDNAGNAGNGATSFTVSVTAGGLCALTQQWVVQPGKGGGIANSLCVKLQQGQANAYINEVNAQSGKAIAADKAAILVSLANHL